MSWVRIIMARVPPTAEEDDDQHEILGSHHLVVGAELAVARPPLPDAGGVELVLVGLVVPQHPPDGGIERADPDVEPDRPTPTMVTVTTMSVPQFEPWRGRGRPTNRRSPSTMPADQSGARYSAAGRDPPAVGPMGVSSRSGAPQLSSRRYPFHVCYPPAVLVVQSPRSHRTSRPSVTSPEPSSGYRHRLPGLGATGELCGGDDRPRGVHEGVVQPAQLAAANGELAQLVRAWSGSRSSRRGWHRPGHRGRPARNRGSRPPR